MSTIVWIILWMVINMETLGIEAIVSLALAGLTLLVTFVGHYFYIRSKLHKAAAGAITNAEQDDKSGEEKLELAVDQVYSLVPTSLKVFIHRSSVRKIVQAAFEKIEDYAKKQVEKKSKKGLTSTEEQDDNKSVAVSKINVSQLNVSTKISEVKERMDSDIDKNSQPESDNAIKWYLV